MTDKLSYIALIVAALAFVMAGDPSIEQVKTGDMKAEMSEKLKGSVKSFIPDRAVCKGTGWYESVPEVKITENGDRKEVTGSREIMRCYWSEFEKRPALNWYGVTF